MLPAIVCGYLTWSLRLIEGKQLGTETVRGLIFLLNTKELAGGSKKMNKRKSRNL
jgi:hypothetical protein